MAVDVVEDENVSGVDTEVRAIAEEVMHECSGMSGTLRSVGWVIRACVSSEILKSNTYPQILAFFPASFSLAR